MQDVEAGILRKTVERKKYLQVVSMLKEFVRATTIIICILDLELNWTVDELQALASTVEK